MRSERSSKEMSTIIKTDIKRFWALPLVSLIFMFISGPFIIMQAEVFIEESGPFSDNLNPGFMFAYILLGVGLGMALFNYMVGKKASNYVHALPITRERLFASHFTAGIIMMLVPILINGIAMNAVTGFKYTGNYVEMTIAAMIMTSVMFAITVFASTISGNIVMHLFSSGFFNGLAMMVLLVLQSYLSTFMYGYSGSEIMEELLKSSLPLIAFRFGLKTIPTVTYLCIFFGMTIISLAIYKKRPVENAGDSLVFGWTKMLLLGLVTFLGSALMGQVVNLVIGEGGGLTPELVGGIITGFILTFVVMGVIIEKTPKIFTKPNMATAMVTALVITLMVGVLQLDAFGFSGKVVAADGVKEAAVTVSPVDSLMYERLNPENFDVKSIKVTTGEIESSGTVSVMLMEDKDNIREICAIQKTMVERRYDVENDASDMSSHLVTVISDRGKWIKRSYSNLDDGTLKAVKPNLKRIFESEEFKKGFLLANLKEDKIIMSYQRNEDGDYETIPNGKMNELKKALDKDFMDMSYEDYLDSTDSDDDEGEGSRISVTLVKEKKSDRDDRFFDYDYETEMDILLSKAYKNTNKWLKENM